MGERGGFEARRGEEESRGSEGGKEEGGRRGGMLDVLSFQALLVTLFSVFSLLF